MVAPVKIERLGDYVLDRPIASGGMGEIYLAHPKDDPQRDLVIKFVQLRTHGESAREKVRMFLDEARVATLLDHPNIVRVYEVGFERGVYFMVMELLIGWDLHQIAKQQFERKSLCPVPILLRWMIDACQGLEAAHTCTTDRGEPINLVHRDISLANLFVTAGGSVKLIDFGVAKSTIQVARTEVGTIKGKVSYMSPEQCRGEPLDLRSDLWALGVILHELLTGRRLFSRSSLLAASHAVTRGLIPPPSRVDEEVPQGLIGLTMRALQRDRNLRFTSAAHMALSLEELSHSVGLASHQDVTVYVTDLFGNAPSLEHTTLTVSNVDSALSMWAGTVVDRLETLGGEEPATGTDLLDGLTTRVDNPLAPARRRFLGWRDALAGGSRALRITVGAAVVLAVAGVVALTVGGGGAEEKVSPPISATPNSAASAADLDSEGARSPGPGPTTATDAAPAPDPVALPDEPAPARAESTAIKNRASRRAAARRASRASRAAVEAKTGRLTLQSRPWARIYLGDRLLGSSPLVEETLPAGTHTLRLVNPEAGLEREVQVTIPAGGIVRESVELR